MNSYKRIDQIGCRKRNMIRAAAMLFLLLVITSVAGAEGGATGISPTTGLPTDKPYRPVLVSVSNDHGARPVVNLSEADVVYEYVYWGTRHTRYLAVYNDQHPELVNSIRSIRINSAELREEWDCPLVFWNYWGQEGKKLIDTFFRSQKVPEEMVIPAAGGVYGRRSSSIYFRWDKDGTRNSPHTGSANIQRVVDEHWLEVEKDGITVAYEPDPPAFRFSMVAEQGDAEAHHLSIPYEEANYFPEYTFNQELNLYERWYCGYEQRDGGTNKRIVASNVIVQYVEHSYRPNIMSDLYIQTFGLGTMDAFIGGQHIRGTWQRETLSDRTEFLNAAGEQITFLPGKTFIQVVPPGMVISFFDELGVEHTLSMEE